jgi:hypothetical protein
LPDGRSGRREAEEHPPPVDRKGGESVRKLHPAAIAPTCSIESCAGSLAPALQHSLAQCAVVVGGSAVHFYSYSAQIFVDRATPRRLIERAIGEVQAGIDFAYEHGGGY